MLESYPWHQFLSPTNVPSEVLVLVGIGGVIAALMTLRAIRRQIEVQEESLRPRIAIGIAKNIYPDMVQGKKIMILAEFVNTGGVPAYEVIPEIWIEWLARRSDFEFTSAALYQKGEAITVHPGKPTHYLIPFRKLTEAEIYSFHSATSTICLRIRLTYRAFGCNACTQDAFNIEPEGAGIIAKYSESN